LPARRCRSVLAFCEANVKAISASFVVLAAAILLAGRGCAPLHPHW